MTKKTYYKIDHNARQGRAMIEHMAIKAPYVLGVAISGAYDAKRTNAQRDVWSTIVQNLFASLRYDVVINPGQWSGVKEVGLLIGMDESTLLSFECAYRDFSRAYGQDVTEECVIVYDCRANMVNAYYLYPDGTRDHVTKWALGQ